MREELRVQLQGIAGPEEGRNRVREYLQARILASLQCTTTIRLILSCANS